MSREEGGCCIDGEKSALLRCILCRMPRSIGRPGMCVGCRQVVVPDQAEVLAGCDLTAALSGEVPCERREDDDDNTVDDMFRGGCFPSRQVLQCGETR